MLEKAVVELAELQPSFVSVTYGALGSSRERTRDVVTRINHEQAVPGHAPPHLRRATAAATSPSSSTTTPPTAIENILALGGDPPADGSDPGGEYEHASRAGRRRCESTPAASRWAWRPTRDPPSLTRPRERPPLPRRQARRGRLRDDASSSSPSTTTCASSTSWPSSAATSPSSRA